MVNVKIQNWLEKLDIKLQESFAESLKKLAQEFQKEHNIVNIEKVYALLGIKKQYITYWEQHPYSTQAKTKKKI